MLHRATKVLALFGLTVASWSIVGLLAGIIARVTAASYLWAYERTGAIIDWIF